MNDAFAIAQQILEDHQTGSLLGAPGTDPDPSPDQSAAGITAEAKGKTPLRSEPEEGIPPVVKQGLKEGKVVDLAGWRRIDEAEKERAKRNGGRKEREKFRRVEEMLAVLG